MKSSRQSHNTTRVRYEVSAHGAAFGGDGVARAPDGRVVFVPMLLPGERALVEVVERKARFDRAQIVELLTAGEGRRSAPCPVYERCGGCNMQHADIGTQREIKARVTADLDRRVGAFSYQDTLNATAPQVVGGAEFGYRNRVRLHSAGSAGFGFRARSSHDIVPISFCPIAAPEVNELLNELGAVQRGSLRAGQTERDPVELSVYGAQGRVFRAGTATVEVLGFEFSFPVDGFFQSNLEMTEMLIREEILSLEGGSHALDLYAGCGVFTRFLAGPFASVTAVESHPGSVAAQRLNLADLQNVTSVEARVEDWCGKEGFGRSYDLAVLDPPRAGLSGTVQQYLTNTDIKRLLYVSCDPASSARDVGALIRGGYNLRSRRVFDFYPQSSHIETVTVLERE
ncbi:MAG: class I SAM-dependent RNA methyltransferase [Spirochaetaceae bacterium]|nr:MAG: class I SAM-dependent RNA methyltransferase [Spirochaetaceae bacterium]